MRLDQPILFWSLEQWHDWNILALFGFLIFGYCLSGDNRLLIEPSIMNGRDPSSSHFKSRYDEINEKRQRVACRSDEGLPKWMNEKPPVLALGDVLKLGKNRIA